MSVYFRYVQHKSYKTNNGIKCGHNNEKKQQKIFKTCQCSINHRQSVKDSQYSIDIENTSTRISFFPALIYSMSATTVCICIRVYIKVLMFLLYFRNVYAGNTSTI